ncbi:hypothetical protein [Halovivax sp.]|uniref:hypothetical protein n=1 Tax=Halovivax sp. TaxID=1935978 RepID=UPI0025B7E4C6|nr:hypothetical protein [Halovivax sp.]
MDRRTFLTTTVVAAVLAGCSEIRGDSGPDDAAEEFYEALDAADADAVGELLHPDADGWVSETDLAPFEDLDLTVAELAVLDEDDETATVRVEYEIDGEWNGEPVDAADSRELAVRTADGEWAIAEPSVPTISTIEAAVEAYYEALGGGDVDAVNARIHPDSDHAELTRSDVELIEGLDFAVERVEVLEEDDEAAVVEADVHVRGEIDGVEIDEVTNDVLEIRTHGAEWKLYD